MDTAVLIYLLQGEPLPAPVEAVFASPANTIFFSPLNVAEVAIKHAKRKLPLPVSVSTDLHAAVQRLAVQLQLEHLPLGHHHAVRLAYLPRIHDDPFDRLLIAQALVENLTVMSCDGKFSLYTDLRLLRF